MVKKWEVNKVNNEEVEQFAKKYKISKIDIKYIIKLFTILVIIGVLYFLLFNNIYLFDINILYTKITIIENIKKISGSKYKISFKK